MDSRNLFASLVMACLLSVGLGSLAPVADAASAGQSFLHPGVSAGSNVIEIKRRGSGPRIHLPLGPGSVYYDYPYYYSRGYYPTHIGGYVYYPYSYKHGHYAKSGGQCSKWHRKCAANWGEGNADYYGCMDYHGCE